MRFGRCSCQRRALCRSLSVAAALPCTHRSTPLHAVATRTQTVWHSSTYTASNCSWYCTTANRPAGCAAAMEEAWRVAAVKCALSTLAAVPSLAERLQHSIHQVDCATACPSGCGAQMLLRVVANAYRGGVNHELGNPRSCTALLTRMSSPCTCASRSFLRHPVCQSGPCSATASKLYLLLSRLSASPRVSIHPRWGSGSLSWPRWSCSCACNACPHCATSSA